MEIEVDRLDNGFHLQVKNKEVAIDVTASPALMGDTVSKGFRPMELVLSGLGTCMSIDVLNILYKQRQVIDTFKVSVRGERSNEPPGEFTKIELDIHLSGPIDESRLQRAIKLSEEKFCSVYHTLDPAIEIITSYYLNDEQ